MIRFGVAAVVLLGGWSGVASAAQDANPWRLDATIDSPDSFSLGGSYRVAQRQRHQQKKRSEQRQE